MNKWVAKLITSLSVYRYADTTYLSIPVCINIGDFDAHLQLNVWKVNISIKNIKYACNGVAKWAHKNHKTQSTEQNYVNWTVFCLNN